MRGFRREPVRPTASAQFLWDDAETGDRLRISIRVREEGHEAFFSDLEATGFHRLGAELDASSQKDSGQPEMPAQDARRNELAEEKGGEDGGMLPCSIDVISAYHVPGNERQFADRVTTDEDPEEARRDSA